MIRCVIFDVGNVLIDFRWPEMMRDDLGITGDKFERIADGMVRNPRWAELDRGVIPEKEIIEGFYAAMPDLRPELDGFWSNIHRLVVPFPDSAGRLRSLKERGYKVLLLSNYPESMWKLHSRSFDFLEYTDGQVVSWREKLIKPDERIFRTLLERYQLKPEECVFLDDSRANTDAAEKLGISVITVSLGEKRTEAFDRLEEMLNK